MPCLEPNKERRPFLESFYGDQKWIFRGISRILKTITLLLEE
jgi:hypothetical protein